MAVLFGFSPLDRFLALSTLKLSLKLRLSDKLALKLPEAETVMDRLGSPSGEADVAPPPV